MFPYNNHVNPELDQLGRQRREPIRFPLRIAVLKSDVLALRIAHLTQTLPEYFKEECSGVRRAEREKTDPRNFARSGAPVASAATTMLRARVTMSPTVVRRMGVSLGQHGVCGTSV